jgi:hypothetical protein
VKVFLFKIFQYQVGGIIGTIVYHYYFVVGVILLEDGRQIGAQVLRLVAGADNDRYRDIGRNYLVQRLIGRKFAVFIYQVVQLNYKTELKKQE